MAFSRIRSGAHAAVLALAVLSATTFASAEAPPSAADQLFREGREAMAKRDYAKAITKLEASQKLEPAAGTLLNLADCYEQSGRLASAWETYIQARQAAQKRGRNDWVELATERITNLGPKLSKLRLVGTLSPRERAELDGKPLDVAGYGPSLPVDTGKHRIVVFEGDKPRRAIDFDVAPGRVEEVRLDGGKPVPAMANQAPTAQPLSLAPEDRRPASGPSPFVWVLGGAAVASAAVGGTLLVVRSGQVSDVTKELEVKNCLGRGLDNTLYDTCKVIREKPTMSFAPPVVAFVASGIFAASALGLYFATKSTQDDRKTGQVLCAPGFASAACTVRF